MADVQACVPSAGEPLPEDATVSISIGTSNLKGGSGTPPTKKARVEEETSRSEQQQDAQTDCSPSEETAADAVAAPVAAAVSQAPQEVRDVLLVKRLSEHAVLPRRGSAYAAGYDLSSAHACVIPARGKALVKTDLAIKVPPGTYGRVAPRSGLAVKNFIDTGAGVVDEDYRGNVGVLLFNHSDTDFQVNHGDRIAQLVLERITTPEVEEVQELDATERGAGGYGSTGVAAAAAPK